jgi:hypothetical protein
MHNWLLKAAGKLGSELAELAGLEAGCEAHWQALELASASCALYSAQGTRDRMVSSSPLAADSSCEQLSRPGFQPAQESWESPIDSDLVHISIDASDN